MNATSLPLLLGFLVMAVGSVTVYAKGTQEPTYRHHTHFHTVVPFIAATSYLAMYLGTGTLQTPSGTLYVARYCDWSATTPILLTGLVLTALHEHRRTAGFVTAIVVLDVIMIVTGFLSAISVAPALRLAWYAWSCVAFAGVLYLLWVPLRRISGDLGEPLDGVYRANLLFLTVVWLCYPLAFALGPQGLGITSETFDVWTILVLDTIAKVVYGLVSTSRFDRLPAPDDTGEPEPAEVHTARPDARGRGVRQPTGAVARAG